MRDLIEQSKAVLLGTTELNENLFRLQGTVNPIISKALSEFMKNNKKLSSKDEFASAWSNKKNLTAFNNTIVAGVLKKISADDVAYITTNASSVAWSFKDSTTSSAVTATGSIYVNVGINDDANAAKQVNKVKGSLNDPIQTSDSVLNKFDGTIQQNIELQNNTAAFLIENK